MLYSARDLQIPSSPCLEKVLFRVALALGMSALAIGAHAQESGSAIQLGEIVVQGQSSRSGVLPPFAGGQVATGARLGVLGNTETKKSPFSVASYTDQLIRDRQAITASEALALDPSVRATQGTGAPFDSFYIRGYPVNEGTSGEVAFDGVYGVAPSLRIFTDYAERIEVLRGPRPRSRACRPTEASAASSTSCRSAPGTI